MIITDEQRRALTIARELAELGMPLFLAQPDASKPGGYALPPGWQRSTADPQVVDYWQPGLALCAVTGHVLDLIDVDPRSGGRLPDDWAVPAIAMAETPSGGQHYFVPRIGVASRDGVYPGVDVKSGTDDGQGRGFAFIAPTVRVSKVDGQAREYVWNPHDAPEHYMRHRLNRWWENPDFATGMLTVRNRIAELRSSDRRPGAAPRTIPMSVARNEWDRAYAKLVDDLRYWSATGWGGEAHAGLLAHTTHLARLNPEHAPDAFHRAFEAAGLQPDDADMLKIETAVANAVPDIVVPDDQMPSQDLFWAGAVVPTEAPPGGGGLDPSVGPAETPAPQPGHTFAPVSRERYRNRKPPLQPSVGMFGGAHGLFYGEGVHWLQGESESGKTWVALALVAEALAHGQRVCYVDYEHTEDALLERLEALQVTDDQIELLTLVSGMDVLFSELAAHVRDSDYAMLVVDGVTGALDSAGCSGRDEQELTRWTNALPRQARMAVCIDHVVKAVDERKGMAVGTQAKKSVVTGSSWEVYCPPKGKFGRGRSGYILMTLQKDKHGGIRGRGVADKPVRLQVVSDALTGALGITVPRGEDAEVQAYQEASKAAEREVQAEAIKTWLDSTFSPSDAAFRKVRDVAHGTAGERKEAGGNCGTHNHWPKHLIESVWRVWKALADPVSASPNDDWERSLYAKWST